MAEKVNEVSLHTLVEKPIAGELQELLKMIVGLLHALKPIAGANAPKTVQEVWKRIVGWVHALKRRIQDYQAVKLQPLDAILRHEGFISNSGVSKERDLKYSPREPLRYWEKPAKHVGRKHSPRFIQQPR